MSGLACVHFRQISRVCFLYAIIYWAFGTYIRSLSRPKFPMSFAGLTSIICIFSFVFFPVYTNFFYFFYFGFVFLRVNQMLILKSKSVVTKVRFFFMHFLSLIE